MSSRKPYKLDRVAIRMVKEPPLYSSEPLRAPDDFYDADWCGILIADLQTQAFIPEIWYEPEIGPMQDI